MKSIWDELETYRPSCTCGSCTCGGNKKISDYCQYEYLICFLMDLNESYGPLRSQILLMDPSPTVAKAFAMIAQEEQQRAVPVLTSTPTLTLAVNAKQVESSQKSQKDRVCTHCGYHNHTVDKCYTLHGYPLGHRFKGNRTHNAHSVMTESSSSETLPTVSEEIAHCHSILSMLQTRLGAVKIPDADLSNTHIAGKMHFQDDWQG